VEEGAELKKRGGKRRFRDQVAVRASWKVEKASTAESHKKKERERSKRKELDRHGKADREYSPLTISKGGRKARSAKKKRMVV